MEGKREGKKLVAAEHVSEKLGLKTLPPVQFHFAPRATLRCVPPRRNVKEAKTSAG